MRTSMVSQKSVVISGGRHDMKARKKSPAVTGTLVVSSDGPHIVVCILRFSIRGQYLRKCTFLENFYWANSY